MGVIRFNGISSADFGCTIERRPNHTRGSRRGELIEVPGRNGVVVLEDGSFTTYKQEYVMAFKEGDTIPPYKRAAQVAEWLLGSRGFCRLEDDFEPNVYRMARYAGALNIEQVADKYGQVVLEFECQPQRFLKSGESVITFDRTKLAGEAELYNQKITIHPLPHGTRTIKLDVLQSDQWSGGSIGKLELISVDSPDSGIETPMNEVPGEGDFRYTNVMDSSSARYIAGSRYSMNSHAFVDSKNPECDCVVVPVPQNNETVRIRIKNATFSNWNTVYGGTTNNAFNKDYGRNPVNPSAPQDEHGDYYFDFQNDGSRFITFNIDPMSNPSSLIVTVNEPIIVINPDGLNEYVGTHQVSESYVAQENHAVRLSYFDSSNGSWFFRANLIIQDVDGNTLMQAILSGTNMVLYNPTEHEARPLISVTGTPTSPPSPVTQTLTMRDDYIVNQNGSVVEIVDPSMLGYYAASNPVSVSGYGYAYVTGSGYAFLDSNGKTRKGGFATSTSGNLNNKKLIIPAWASTIVVCTGRTNTNKALKLQTAYIAGVATATVNGTTINLDFSAHGTIYLDCDLHDAYYEDGSNANPAVSFSSTMTDYPTFPGLAPEGNTISVSYDNTVSFEIVPRWWVL